MSPKFRPERQQKAKCTEWSSKVQSLGSNTENTQEANVVLVQGTAKKSKCRLIKRNDCFYKR